MQTVSLEKYEAKDIPTLEIKPCRLGSRIRDMETESYN